VQILDLKLFCDLVELKSFTKAADNNFLSQSAVSQRINKLNEYYNNTLFLDKKRLILSSQGKFVYEKFKDILHIYSSTERIVDKKIKTEIVSIGMCENAKIRYFDKSLLKILLGGKFLAEVFFSPSRTIYEKILFGLLDYGIIGNQPTESSGMVFNELYNEKILLVTAVKNASNEVNFKEVPIILDHRDSGLYEFVKNRLLSFDISIDELNIAGYVGTSADKLAVLRENEYFCFLPERYVEENPDLKMVDLGFDLGRSFYEIYMEKRKDKVAFLRKLIRETNNSIS
jgi:DNA-binding transcriptional LysR family regulator